MQAVVKKPHIKVELSGTDETVQEVLNLLTREYPAFEVVDNDNGSISIEDTEFWQKTTRGQLLAGYRGKHELTQKQLAVKSGICQSVISAYENDTRPITETAARKLGKALGEDYLNFFKI